MGWEDREMAQYVTLGDKGEKQVRHTGGILLRIVPGSYNGKPKDAPDYEFINKRGEICLLSGSGALKQKIRASDIGKFFRAEFEGWDHNKNGDFKKIKVQFYSGEPTEEMKRFPGFNEYYGKGAGPATVEERKDPSLDEPPPSLQDDDDDLPF